MAAWLSMILSQPAHLFLWIAWPCMQAEEVRAHSRFAKGLRTLARGSSKWWSDIPEGISALL